MPVGAQGHVEQHEQANRDGVEDKASHTGLIGPRRFMVEGWVGLLEAGNALAPNDLTVPERVKAQHNGAVGWLVGPARYDRIDA